MVRTGASVIKIDCTLGLPLGLCCLEKDCSCTTLSALNVRESERELARQGIGCYFSTKRSLIRAIAYRDIALMDALVRHGVEILEVYPYAVKLTMWGDLLAAEPGFEPGLGVPETPVLPLHYSATQNSFTSPFQNSVLKWGPLSILGCGFKCNTTLIRGQTCSRRRSVPVSPAHSFCKINRKAMGGP